MKYKGQPWCTVLLEIGHNELGAADESERVPLPEEVIHAFTSLGFPAPEPIPLMPLKYQVAQKLHGLSARNSDRVRDLIDLQLIFASENLHQKPVDFTVEPESAFHPIKSVLTLILLGEMNFGTRKKVRLGMLTNAYITLPKYSKVQ